MPQAEQKSATGATGEAHLGQNMSLYLWDDRHNRVAALHASRRWETMLGSAERTEILCISARCADDPSEAAWDYRQYDDGTLEPRGN
jgi:hypothetical protein